MKLSLLPLFLFASLVCLHLAQSMGICFGKYPQCCFQGNKGCGPFCASCSRAGEFLANMNMFSAMGRGMGSPEVFRLINNDPFVGGPAAAAGRPFPNIIG